MELTRLNGTRYPLLGIGIGGGGHFLTTQFVLFLGLSMLYPLIILHRTTERNSLGTDTEIGIRQRILGGGQCRTTDQFSFERGILLVGILHLHVLAACLVEHLLGLHGATFIPPKESRTQHEQQKSAANCLK